MPTAAGEADFLDDGHRDRDGHGSDAGPALATQRKGRYPHHLHLDIQRSLITVQMLTREHAGVQVSMPQRRNLSFYVGRACPFEGGITYR